jgi:hypothetical protein
MTKVVAKGKGKTSGANNFFEENKFPVIMIAAVLAFSILLLVVGATRADITGRLGEDVHPDGTAGATYPESGSVDDPALDDLNLDVTRTVPRPRAEASFEIEGLPKWLDTILVYTIGDPFRRADKVKDFLDDPLGKNGVIVIHVMIWLILFLAFGYIFSVFLFNDRKFKVIPWIVGFAMAAIVANFGFISGAVGLLAGVLGGLAGISVFIAMFIAVASFVAVTFLGNRIKIHAMKKVRDEVKDGGSHVEVALANMGKVFKGLRDANDEARS